MIKLGQLHHGGIMPNYQCSAACRHCLYACSPDYDDAYMTQAAMDEVCGTLREGGCRSVHIGGGEPFLHFDGLLSLLQTAKKHGITVDYIETNASWHMDDAATQKRLQALARAGADTLCISVDPYHAEYIPYARPLALADLCRREGFGYFLWQERFLSMLTQLDLHKVHSRAAMEAVIPNYIWRTAQMYGLKMGGRAICIEAEYVPHKPLAACLSTQPCHRLLSTDHFHVDYHGSFIPPGCTGIVLPLADAIRGIPSGRYPAFEALLTGGVTALLAYANEKGFTAAVEGYPSACALCFHIRSYLANTHAEFNARHYEQALRYYK